MIVRAPGTLLVLPLLALLLPAGESTLHTPGTPTSMPPQGVGGTLVALWRLMLLRLFKWRVVNFYVVLIMMMMIIVIRIMMLVMIVLVYLSLVREVRRKMEGNKGRYEGKEGMCEGKKGIVKGRTWERMKG